VIAFHRWRAGGRRDDVVVVVNFSDKPYDDYGLGFPRPGTWRVRFCSTHKGYSPDFAGTDVPDVDAVSGTGKLVLPASTALIFSQD